MDGVLVAGQAAGQNLWAGGPRPATNDPIHYILQFAFANVRGVDVQNIHCV